MRTEQETKVVVDPDKVAAAKYPTTLMLEELILQDVAPAKWKAGMPPKDRDATVNDLSGRAKVRVTGNVVEAVW